MDAVVREANEHLAQDAARPRPDLGTLRSKAKKLKGEIDALFDRLDGLTDEAVRRAYEARISQRQRELDEVRARLRQAEAESVETPPPLDPARVQVYLSDLRGLLNDEVPAAAEALRALTGKIVVRQGVDPSRKRGAPWTATFSPDVMRLLRKVAGEKDFIQIRSLWST